MDFSKLIQGGKFVLGQAAETAIVGWEGKVQNAIAEYGLGTLQNIVQKIVPEFKIGQEDFTVFGSIGYWDRILGNIKDANQRLGIAGNLGMNLQTSFKEAYPLVIGMGISAEDMAKSVESYFSKTGRAQILSANQMAEMAKMTKILGEESMEIVTAYGRTGLSITNATSRMRNLIKESDKFGVLPSKVTGILKNNLEASNKYSFKDGVKALEKMAIYAAKTNTDMKSAFSMADKILEGGIEGTMELSTELQLLGGSFGNMTNFSELIYLARNDTGKFQEMLMKSAADMAEFNAETGEIKYSAYSMDVFRKIAQATGADINELVNGGKALKKSLMIKDELDTSLKGLKNYDELLTKVSGAAYRNDLGEWVVKLKEGGKDVERAVSALTEEQIKQISFTDETKGPEAAFEKIATSNERLKETMDRLIDTIKAEALSAGGYEKFSEIARTAADNIKELASPLIEKFKELNKAATENVMSVLDPASKGDISGAVSAAGENLTGAVSKAAEVGSYALGQIGTILYNVFSNAAKFLAAGIEWGFRKGMTHIQNGLIKVYNSTVGYLNPIEYYKPEDVNFSEILKGYSIKGVLEDTTIREDFYNTIGINPNQSNTNPPVTNTPVPEVKKEAEVEKKLTSGEDNKTKKVEVEFKNPIDVNVQGNTSQLNDKNIIREEVKNVLENTVNTPTKGD